MKVIYEEYVGCRVWCCDCGRDDQLYFATLRKRYGDFHLCRECWTASWAKEEVEVKQDWCKEGF